VICAVTKQDIDDQHLNLRLRLKVCNNMVPLSFYHPISVMVISPVSMSHFQIFLIFPLKFYSNDPMCGNFIITVLGPW
jgi:hypothetical protein